ncbi:hypothetical protein CERSUDRAFT_114919 [Gelatoporia subvermispora B]|uniref:Uncharacterized protein n=1 Tax=Ceriporiopsis subvermispora (strain B) TaxID=914234 RepID=M2PL50_CERS8|nr:hypothetical protein CERSUDRAFT_114919 [Gelatoporia subvermispora B]
MFGSSTSPMPSPTSSLNKNVSTFRRACPHTAVFGDYTGTRRGSLQMQEDALICIGLRTCKPRARSNERYNAQGLVLGIDQRGHSRLARKVDRQDRFLVRSGCPNSM